MRSACLLAPFLLGFRPPYQGRNFPIMEASAQETSLSLFTPIMSNYKQNFHLVLLYLAIYYACCKVYCNLFMHFIWFFASLNSSHMAKKHFSCCPTMSLLPYHTQQEVCKSTSIGHAATDKTFCENSTTKRSASLKIHFSCTS